MIKSAIKNYFEYFKYAFTAMGVIYLAVLIAIFSLISGAGNILASAAEASFAELSAFVQHQLQNLSFVAVFQNHFIKNFIDGILNIFDEGGQNIVAKLVTLCTGLLSFVLLSCKLAGWLTRRLIKKDLSDSETKWGLLVMIVRYMLTLIGAVLLLILTYYWVYSAIIVLFVFGVLKANEQLFSTWFVYCKRSLTLKEMFRAKHVFQVMLANFVSIATNLVVILLCAVLVNLFFALLVAIPLVVYSFTIIDFTTVSYFQQLKQPKLPVMKELK